MRMDQRCGGRRIVCRVQLMGASKGMCALHGGPRCLLAAAGIPYGSTCVHALTIGCLGAVCSRQLGFGAGASAAGASQGEVQEGCTYTHVHSQAGV